MKKSIVNSEYNPEPIISVCGDDCAVCPRYLAKTDEELKRVAEYVIQKKSLKFLNVPFIIKKKT